MFLKKKKLSRNYLRWRYRYNRNVLGKRYKYESRLVDFLKQRFLTGGTRTPWGYEALKQGVRSTKFFLGYTP